MSGTTDSKLFAPEERIRKDHPLRTVRKITDEFFEQNSPLMEASYARIGRSSIPPEKLLRGHLLQVLYSVRSETLLMEEIDYSILFRWFVGLSPGEEVWDAALFAENRDRLLQVQAAREFFAQVLANVRSAGLIWDEHFDVDESLQ
jgi:transposase